MKTKELSIPVTTTLGSVSGELIMPVKSAALLLLAHGAGAGMQHHFMVDLSHALYENGIATLRYNFPYMESGKKRPDPPAIAEKTVGMVIERSQQLYPDLPLFGAGKSFGSRMTSQYLSKNPAASLRGLIFYGFPLHAAGKPSIDRSAHLQSITKPMLFLQGTRDALATIGLMEEICQTLRSSTLVKFEGADHSFKAGKKELIPTLAETTAAWIKKLA
ncbi:MAG TPA: alpha/beta family hydrolase [Ohtaekwangia sp.]|nr:alpha/beta family hydrolase [Ohtaekwangia sp.]